ncbi:sporulation protein [Seongchinamella sediminis]|uniref:Sporulation protein n=1 Tax=Seongchinamella sediminis TaxID=2283635 RepID=A0A3L7E4I3_9GAMM|nr:SPOR domain-containing protein [Seongchinamella sediminis]RLQ23493.1 sporulation protein [Seongchinamella sediminis]
MGRDYAKKGHGGRKPPSARKKTSSSARTTQTRGSSGWRWYGAGVVTGVFLSFLAYLGSLPPAQAPGTAGQASPAAEEPAPPKPRFDFYTMLPEQSLEDEAPPPEPARPAASPGAREYYLLQAGSFRQREDADRRRAELLLLGLEPAIEENTGENGRWFRVYLGPFDSRAKMSRARSMTAAQNIDTLLLKRGG